MFPFAILGINQGHNLKFEALIEVRPLTTLEGGQVATGGVNGESFGDDLLKKFFMCLILAVLGLCGVWAFFIFRERGLLPSGAWGLTAVASLVAGHRLQGAWVSVVVAPGL